MAKKTTVKKVKDEVNERLHSAPETAAASASGDVATPKKNAFSIPNGAIGCLLILLNIPLHGEQSRARNRLVKIFDAQRTVCLKQHLAIQEKYAEKEADGSFKKPPEGDPNPYLITPENEVLGEKELMSLMRTPFEVDLDTNTKRAFLLMRPKILESQVPMDTTRGMDYELICEEFEKI